MQRSTRLKISNLYMDIAASLPRIDRVHWLRGLQSRAEFRNKRKSLGTPKGVKPDGVDLHFLFIRIVELFHVEDFPDLMSGLADIFPKMNERDSADIFESIGSGGFDQASWRNIGTIFRIDPGFPFPSTQGVLKSLPECIDNIRVEATHYLPSTVAITFDVILRPNATMEMNRIHAADYFPQITFRNLLPWKACRGYSTMDSERVRQEEVANWFRSLRKDIENCIAKHIKGHFLKKTRVNAPCLPAIEVFVLTGTSEQKYRKWKSENHQWLSSFAFPTSWSNYGNSDLRYFPARKSGRDTAPGRLLFFSHLWSDDLLESSHDSCKGFTLIVAMQSLLRSIQDHLETLRRLTFVKSETHKHFLQKMDVYEDILRESTILDRFRLEFNERKDIISAEMMGTETAKYRMSRKKDENLRDHTIAGLEKRSSLLSRYISQVQSTFSALVDVREIRANLQLQRKIFWLGIVAAVAAVVGALGAWTGFKELLADGFSIHIGRQKAPSTQASPEPSPSPTDLVEPNTNR